MRENNFTAGGVRHRVQHRHPALWVVPQLLYAPAVDHGHGVTDPQKSVINKTRTLVRPSLRAKLRPVIEILQESAGPSRAVVGRPCGALSPYRDGGLRDVGGEDHLEARSHQKETVIEAPILVANLVQSG